MIKYLIKLFCKTRACSVSCDEHRLSEPKTTWKTSTTMDHGALVKEHLQMKAYLIAEKDGVSKSPEYYWHQAEQVR